VTVTVHQAIDLHLRAMRAKGCSNRSMDGFREDCARCLADWRCSRGLENDVLRITPSFRAAFGAACVLRGPLSSLESRWPPDDVRY